jgi:hypothetical protein
LAFHKRTSKPIWAVAFIGYFKAASVRGDKRGKLPDLDFGDDSGRGIDAGHRVPCRGRKRGHPIYIDPVKRENEKVYLKIGAATIIVDQSE